MTFHARTAFSDCHVETCRTIGFRKPPRPICGLGALPRKGPAASCAIQNASASSSSTDSMKDVHSPCALALSWTHRRTGSQSNSIARLLHPLGLTASQGFGLAHDPLLGLNEPRGHNSDGHGRFAWVASHAPARSRETTKKSMTDATT